MDQYVRSPSMRKFVSHEQIVFHQLERAYAIQEQETAGESHESMAEAVLQGLCGRLAGLMDAGDEMSSNEGDDMMDRHDDGARSDDFDDFEDSMAQYSSAPSGGGGKSNVVQNQPYDEAVELSDEEGSPAQRGRRAATDEPQPVANQPFDEAVELSSEESEDMDVPPPQKAPPQQQKAQMQMASSGGMAALAGSRTAGAMSHEAEGEHDFAEMQRHQPPMRQGQPELSRMGSTDREEGGFDGSEGGVPEEGLYNPAEYADLAVSSEINELFQYIGRYKPHAIELETKMRPFIPDYIPAVGDIDSFVKVPRPDGKPDLLGLAVMDEPAATQSDPTVLTLQLRAVTKSSGAQPMLVRSVEHAEKNPKAISGWISSISELHRHKPPPSVRYSRPMPDVDALMQIWPAQMEELLETARLPDADLQVDLASYVRIVCAMLDIPVHGDKLTESLHLLFTLYSDFKANVHFQQQLSNESPALESEVFDLS
ncbi:hypothetical protein AB1Y20_011950 [Prymnesium parvum]|uniref:Intraflagellar transport protein 46 homolog n=1 Tax=Prymnesium parvum TaxID=97485 RepID=A0AB34IM26_PRYPA